MWQNTDDRTDAEYNEWLTKINQKKTERDIDPHKREGYAERMYEMADMRRKEIRESQP